MNPDVPRILETLRLQYAKDGVKHPLNDVQATNYLEELSRFPTQAVEAAARQWIRQSRFFPALSDLLGILEPERDPKAMAALAWTEVERCMATVGAYSGIEFADPSVGEAVRQTFGSWPKACSFEYDSPGFAIRRQTFLTIYPELARRTYRETVKLAGMHTNPHRPFYSLVPHIEGLPGLSRALPSAPDPHDDSPIGPTEAKRILADLHQRFAMVKK